MVRSLDAGVITEKDAVSTEPTNFLKIEFGGGVGTKWISDQVFGSGNASSYDNADGRVIEWGTLSSSVRKGFTANSQGDFSFTIHDTDAVYRGYFQTVNVQHTKVTLYQWFAGTGALGLTPLLVGQINTSPKRIADDAVIAIDITDVSSYFEMTVGEPATEDVFPNLVEADTNKVIPVVYGKKTRVKAVQVVAGLKATLSVKLTYANVVGFAVVDGTNLPQDTNFYCYINQEKLEVICSGNYIQIVGRGLAYAEDLTTSQDSGDGLSVVSDELTPPLVQYVGKYIRFAHPILGTVDRRITSATETNTLHFNRVILIGWGIWIPPNGTVFDIISKRDTHEEGSTLRVHQDTYTWIANSVESTAIESVEVWGRVVHTDIYQYTDTDGSSSSENVNRENYIPMPASFYVVDLADADIWPGHTCTSITMYIEPTGFFKSAFANDELYVTIKGKDDGTGSMIENPALMIRDILTTYAGLSYPTDFDTTSFATAETASSWLDTRYAFALTRQMSVLDLVANLAFQMRGVLSWEAGMAKLTYLYNRAPISSEATLTSYREGSLIEEQTNLDEIVTEIVGVYHFANNEKQIIVKDTAAESTFRRRSERVDLFAIKNRSAALTISTFWLNRWNHVNERVRLSKLLTLLELERGDGVTLNITDFFSNQPAEVIEVQHALGSGEQGQIDDIQVLLELPRFAGCTSSCELYCETACESNCEIACQTGCESGCEYACESHCQEACELICVTGCQVTCVSMCEVTCVVGCESSCQGGACETTCVVACEITCQTSCEGTCESDCQTGCELACVSSCESGCETNCETACETSCETGCETSCETGCEVSCESGCQVACELSCETGSESCASSCEAICEIACEVECETGSESCASACEMGCEFGCEVECETGAESCASSCEQGCEVMCETSCEGGCQSGCETSCESGCQFGCEVECESGCQAGCELECETGAESCASTCEVGCETGCQTACETGCETSCETGCETAEEVCLYYDDFEADIAKWTLVIYNGGDALLIHATDRMRVSNDGTDPRYFVWYDDNCDVDHECAAFTYIIGGESGKGVVLRGNGTTTGYALHRSGGGLANCRRITAGVPVSLGAKGSLGPILMGRASGANNIQALQTAGDPNRWVARGTWVDGNLQGVRFGCSGYTLGPNESIEWDDWRGGDIDSIDPALYIL